MGSTAPPHQTAGLSALISQKVRIASSRLRCAGTESRGTSSALPSAELSSTTISNGAIWIAYQNPIVGWLVWSPRAAYPTVGWGGLAGFPRPEPLTHNFRPPHRSDLHFRTGLLGRGSGCAVGRHRSSNPDSALEWRCVVCRSLRKHKSCARKYSLRRRVHLVGQLLVCWPSKKRGRRSPVANSTMGRCLVVDCRARRIAQKTLASRPKTDSTAFGACPRSSVLHPGITFTITTTTEAVYSDKL